MPTSVSILCRNSALLGFLLELNILVRYLEESWACFSLMMPAAPGASLGQILYNVIYCSWRPLTLHLSQIMLLSAWSLPYIIVYVKFAFVRTFLMMDVDWGFYRYLWENAFLF